jgi:Tol biopolymer transport system component
MNPSVKRFIGFGLFPKWSPVGNQILFQRARQRGTQWFSVWTVELVNGEAMRPTEIIASANAAAITPCWSPDAKHVVFATVVNGARQNGDKRPPQSDVWMAALDGTGRTNLTRSRFSNLQPKWSTDGTIYFVSNRGKDGIENIWSIKPERSLQIVKTMDQMAGGPVGSVGMPIPAADDMKQAGVTP